MSSDKWRNVVECYLHACFDDEKNRRKRKSSNQLAKFLQKFGTDSTVNRYHSAADRAKDDLLTPPTSSEWELVAESQHEVVVEIQTCSELESSANQVPFTPTRLRLTSAGETWEVTDIYHACIGCNRRFHRLKTLGNCTLCDGSGILIPGDEEACRLCDGTGKCARCRDELTAGWCRASFLRGN